MSAAHDSMMKVVASARQYLRGDLRAPELVSIVDTLVAEDLLSELEPAVASLVDKLQEALALHASYKSTRLDEPTELMGPFELIEKVREFEAQGRALGY